MKLLFGEFELVGSTDEPNSKLTKISALVVAEDSQEAILLQFLRQQPEILNFQLPGIKGNWVLKKTK